MASEPSFLGPNFFSRAASSSSDSQQFPSPHPPFPESTMVSSGFASMASSPSTFPFFTAPYTFPCPIPTPIDPNWPPAAHTPIHGDLHHTSFPFFPTSAPVHTTVYPPPPFGFGAPPHGPYHHPFPHYDTPERMSATTYHDSPELRPPLPVSWDPIPLITTSTICGSSSAVHSSADHVPSAAKDATPSAATTSSFFGATSTAAASQGMLGKTSITAATPGLFGAASSAASKQDLSSGFTSRAQQAAEDMALRQASAPTQTKEAARDNLAGEIMQIQSRLRQQEYSIQSIQASGFGTQREMQFSEMPHNYGLDNLKRQSVFLADGSEHSYYALPDTYPLERATPQPLFDVYDEETKGCSDKFVDVFAGTLEQQLSYEEEQQENGQLPKCFSKASEIVVPSQQHSMYVTTTDQMQFQASESMPNYDVYEKEDGAYLNIFSDVRDFTRELQQQDDKTSVNLQQLRAPPWHALAIHERRNEWDPEDHSILSSTLNRDITSGFFTVSYVLTARIQFGVPTCVPKQSYYCRVPSSHENHEIQFLWDPGIFNQRDMIMDKSVVPKLVSSGQTTFTLSIFVEQPADLKQSSALLLSTATIVHVKGILSFGKTDQEEKNKAAVYHILLIQLPMSKTSHIWDRGIESILFLYKGMYVHNIQPVHRSALHATVLIMQSAAHLSQGNYLCSLYCSSVLKTEYCRMRCLWKFTIKLATRLQWDPGVPEILDSYTAAHPIEINAMPVIVLPLPWSTCTFVVAEMHQNGSKLRAGQLTYVPHGTRVGSSELALPLKADGYRYIFRQHRPVISFRYAGSSSTCLGDCEWRPFCTQNIFVHRESDIMPHQVQFAHQTRYHPSYVWDPGTLLLQYKSIWLLQFKEEKQKGIPLWLINFQVPLTKDDSFCRNLFVHY